MNTPRLLRRDGIVSPSSPTSITMGCKEMTGELVEELMNAATSFHRLHLKVSGPGSYASHKALNELYDALPDHADTIAEEYQGAAEVLISCTCSAPRMLESVEEAISYLRELKQKINNLQSMMPYTEIVNQLDNTKSLINSVKYKLLFLK